MEVTHCGPPYISVKLRPDDKDPLLLVVDKEPRLELELTDNVEADKVLNCDSKEVMARRASRNCESNNCFSS